MFEKILKKITRQLEESGKIQGDMRDLYYYGIQQEFIILLNFATYLFMGLILGMFWQSFLFLFIYMPLRSFAGGYHARNAESCYVLSVIIITVALLLIKF